MRAYVDSSVILRIVLGEPGRLREWSRITAAVTSEISKVECLRALDRLRLFGGMPDRELARRMSTAIEILSGFELVRLNRTVLDRAAGPFPTAVRTLDALHLASALLLRDRIPSLQFATHDTHQGVAAMAAGLPVIGEG